MKESAFRTSVLRYIPDFVHRQPLPASMMGAGGTPDHYFDYRRDLWVEWKCLDRDDHIPKCLPTKHYPTVLQAAWLTRRYKAGGNAVVIVGIKLRGRAHGFVLSSPEQWTPDNGLDSRRSEPWEPRILAASELAAYIVERVS